MKLKELIKLADAALAGSLASEIKLQEITRNPATVKRMAELLVQCREALMDAHEFIGDDVESYDTACRRIDVLAALDEFAKEQ